MPASMTTRRAPTPASAFFGRKTVEAPPAPPAKKSLFGNKRAAAAAPPAKKAAKAAAPVVATTRQSILEAFDFSQARSQGDAELIARARGMKAGQKMSPEQYAALRRKIGGTAKDYWKGWVEVRGENVDRGYVVSADEATGLPPAAGLLALTLLGMLSVVGVVVQRT